MMCFIPLTHIVFNVDGMNPLKIKILLTHGFDLNGFSRYGGGSFTVFCPFGYSLTWVRFGLGTF